MKTLVVRMSKLLPEISDHDQACALPRRRTGDMLLIIDVMVYCKQQKQHSSDEPGLGEGI